MSRFEKLIPNMKDFILLILGGQTLLLGNLIDRAHHQTLSVA